MENQKRFVIQFSSSLEGTSGERAAASLTEMGPAILNGGITTFLALFLLGFSDSYGFLVFFKVSQNINSMPHV